MLNLRGVNFIWTNIKSQNKFRIFGFNQVLVHGEKVKDNGLHIVIIFRDLIKISN